MESVPATTTWMLAMRVVGMRGMSVRVVGIEILILIPVLLLHLLGLQSYGTLKTRRNHIINYE